MAKSDLSKLDDDLQKHLSKNNIYIYVDNKPHKEPKQGQLKSFAGGIARATSREISPDSMKEIADKLQDQYGVFTKPVEKRDPNLQKCVDIILEDFFKGTNQKKRIENTAIAMIRNPILTKKYGSNTARTRRAKGFNRLMIDTGQFFNAIKASVDV